MTKTDYHALSSKRLIGVHPTLVERIWRVLAAMDALGFPMFVVAGLRTTEEQQALYAQGRTTPGAVITNCDGVTKKSNHQAKDDGFSHAADCAFIPTDEHAAFDSAHPWAVYGACVRAVGLDWGGSWSSFIDRPHAEWRG